MEEFRHNFWVKVSLNETSKTVEHLVVMILIVTVMYDQLVNFGKLGVRAHLRHWSSQECYKFVNIVCEDNIVNLVNVNLLNIFI